MMMMTPIMMMITIIMIMQIADDVKPARIDESSSLGVDLLSLLHCVQKHFACNDHDDDDANDDDDRDDDHDD